MDFFHAKKVFFNAIYNGKWTKKIYFCVVSTFLFRVKKLLELPHSRIAQYKTLMGRVTMTPIAVGMAEQIRTTINLNEHNKKAKLRVAAAKAAAKAAALNARIGACSPPPPPTGPPAQTTSSALATPSTSRGLTAPPIPGGSAIPTLPNREIPSISGGPTPSTKLPPMNQPKSSNFNFLDDDDDFELIRD